MLKGLVLVLILAIIVTACEESRANETNSRFGDRSWQFKNANDALIDQNNLVLYCQRNPSECIGSRNPTVSSGVSGSGSGWNGGGDSIIGNNITIIIQGDGNVVEVDSDQSMDDSPQHIDHDVQDNNIIVNDTMNVDAQAVQ